MAKPLSEEKALKKLEIPDFRHLKKEHVIKLATMLDKMDPEVAKKALEQFPNFSNESKEIITAYKETLDKALNDNAEVVMKYYDVCNSIITTLQNELEKDDLSFDEKQIIIGEMLEVHDRMGMKDSENKKFIATMAAIGAAAAVTVIGVFATILGGDSDIDFPKIEKK